MTGARGIRLACQTYSWQMSGEVHRGRIGEIAAAAATAGFDGLEPEVFMLGHEFRSSTRLRSVLAKSGLELAALTYAAEWRGARETAAERADADGVVDLVRSFPGAKLVLVQLPGRDRVDLAVRQTRALSCMNAVAARALAAGVQPTVHPNSPPGSLFRTADDYEILLEGLHSDIGFTPDLGHIAAAGMDVLETLRRYRERIDHVHLKDIDGDGSWAPTGEGQLDFTTLISFLSDTGYSGWLVFEDESEGARRDPGEAARRNGAYARELLVPGIDSSKNGGR